MKKFFILSSIVVIILFSVNIAEAINFKITGEVFKVVKTNPASRTMIYIDENPDSLIEKVKIEGAKISVYYGSNFYQIDTAKPKLL
ncbi:MAG: hypothetical protein Q8M94_03180, partial [Ignavibacteria bacterium]|nr:hypothetical protein [Ignavibacteria bacterium]